MMKVRDILEHFLSRADWVDRATTVDRVITGDAEADVDRCAVSWMPTCRILQRMVERDLRLLICHEPTFWNHLDDQPANDVEIQEKLQFIRKHQLIIIRNHDCWDLWPDVGITWAWAKFLGFKGKPVATSMNSHQRYDVNPMPLDLFAKQMAARCGGLGEPLVQVTGDASQMVSRIGIGTGCGCDIAVFQQLGCDCSIVCDDGSCYWGGIQRAEDCKHPVIRVNHGTSEDPGMVTLTDYINTHIDGLRAEYLPHGSTFRLVGAL